MKHFIPFAVLLAVLTALAPAARKITYAEAYESTGPFTGLPQITGWQDGQAYLQETDEGVFRVNVADGRRSPVLLAADCRRYASLGFDPLSAEDHTRDWRRFLFLKNNKIHLLLWPEQDLRPLNMPPGEAHNPTFSPDGRSVAFTCGGNLYVYDITADRVRPVTKDGSTDILNGYASWVYYEEILGRASKYRAFHWSPDGRRLAFLRFDQGLVPHYALTQFAAPYNTVVDQRYPKPGYPNPAVTLHVYDLQDGSLRQVAGANDDSHYLTFLQWSPDGRQFFYQILNRGQDKLRIERFDTVTGLSGAIYREEQSTWIDFKEEGDVLAAADGSLWLRSDKSGWPHLYRIAADGRETAFTAGEWSVKGIVGADDRRHRLYFTGSRENSLETHLYAVDWQGGGVTRITSARGSHEIKLSPDARYFIDEYSSVDTPPRLELCDTRGRMVRRLGDGAAPAAAELELARVELLRIPTADGLQLPAKWFLPADFSPQRRYPVLFQVYGGPGHAAVSDSFTTKLANHFLAGQGIIVCQVDHRGSGHFGKIGMNAMHRHLGKWELHDLSEAVRFLRGKPFVDPERIGVTGGSYGGYVTALALLRAPELFSCGIADCGVMDWRLYDSVYTERYMDTPQENPAGYDAASLLGDVSRYRGGLRFTHGTMDDNVHMQNTLLLIEKLQQAGKPFELMIYPGERHGYRGAMRKAENRWAVDFWLRRFFGRSL